MITIKYIFHQIKSQNWRTAKIKIVKFELNQ